MPDRDWALPFLQQAREDLKAAYSIAPSEAASTFCMVLQMVFEKIGKAGYLLGGSPLVKSHRAFSMLFNLLDRNPTGKTILQDNPNARQFVVELELAHPANARPDDTHGQLPQLEYPWEEPATGAVLYPARDLHLAKRVRDPRDRIAADCLKFASALEKHLMEIIP